VSPGGRYHNEPFRSDQAPRTDRNRTVWSSLTSRSPPSAAPDLSSDRSVGYPRGRDV